MYDERKPTQDSLPRVTYNTDLKSTWFYKILYVVSKAGIQSISCWTWSQHWHWQVTWKQELANNNDLCKSLKVIFSSSVRMKWMVEFSELLTPSIFRHIIAAVFS